MLLNRESCWRALFCVALLILFFPTTRAEAKGQSQDASAYQIIDIGEDVFISAEDPYVWLDQILYAASDASMQVPESFDPLVFEQSMPEGLGALRIHINGDLRVESGVTVSFPDNLEIHADQIWIDKGATLQVRGDVTIFADEFHGLGGLKTVAPEPILKIPSPYSFLNDDTACRQGTSCNTTQDTSGGNGASGQDGRDGSDGRNGYCEWWGEAEGGNSGGTGTDGSSGGTGQSAGAISLNIHSFCGGTFTADGGRGGSGGDGGDGGEGGSGACCAFGCKSGKTGGNGGRGGNGSSGGSGGSIQINYCFDTSDGDVTVSVDGGVGGGAGLGGEGGRGGSGGGCLWGCSSGSSGQNGGNGSAGQGGNSGSYSLTYSEDLCNEHDDDGDGFTEEDGDCNDFNADIYPNAEEVCNGADDDCDNAVDEAVSEEYFEDLDGDGVGSGPPYLLCGAPDGYSLIPDDCNDDDDSAYPGAEEVCDQVDNDCDGGIDEGLLEAYFRDDDQDGYGTGNLVDICGDDEGYSQVGGDCNDQHAGVYPGAEEQCDDLDNNCDGQTDEGLLGTYYADGDGDGYGTGGEVGLCANFDGFASNTGDCDDNNNTIHPNAVEGCDGLDNDCDTATDEGLTESYYLDGDGDGYGVGDELSLCGEPDGYATATGDCDDEDEDRHPGADEVCDEKDNDCDDGVDENSNRDYWQDGDGDGYGTGNPEIFCAPPDDSWVSQGEDCDDEEPEVNPGAEELCDNLDNDCDNTTDEGLFSQFFPDSDGDGYGSGDPEDVCGGEGDGFASIDGDCNDEDPEVYPSADEVCDHQDQDCDGSIDEGATVTVFDDPDGDGYGAGQPNEACPDDIDIAFAGGDCDQENAEINPGVEESCDFIDNDCDDNVDEGLTNVYYFDGDGDGFGNQQPEIDCEQYEDYVTNDLDCDDGRAEVNPEADELCDSLDNDCDGPIDEGVMTTYYLDNDDDSYGSEQSQDFCEQPDGYVSNSEDCDDGRQNVNPGADEFCDELDNDCDSLVDEDVLLTFYPDGDGDGYGELDGAVEACEAPADHVQSPGDCDDGEDGTYPGATELCDELDQDCDDLVDEEVTTTFYADGDGDSFGDEDSTVDACSRPDGYVAGAGDCDDDAEDINPQGQEVCDDVDQDCDLQVDEGQLITFYEDGDEDGDGAAESTVEACEQPDGYVDNDGDCDDNNNQVGPSTGVEVCGDEIDQDCNGYDLSCNSVDGDGDGYAPSDGDCDDDNNTVYPGAAETCGDDLDNDCNGNVDDLDADEDGFIAAACAGSDCDDSQAETNPAAQEVCGDGIDNNCDNWTDNVDSDGDSQVAQACGGLDCDDTDDRIFNGATELCDLLDNDCNGVVDDVDGDDDGYLADTCDGDDCNDEDEGVYPGASEVANGIDDDCDGGVDEGLETPTEVPSETGTPGEQSPTSAQGTASDGENTDETGTETFEENSATPEITGTEDNASFSPEGSETEDSGTHGLTPTEEDNQPSTTSVATQSESDTVVPTPSLVPVTQTQGDGGVTETETPESSQTVTDGPHTDNSCDCSSGPGQNSGPWTLFSLLALLFWRRRRTA